MIAWHGDVGGRRHAARDSLAIEIGAAAAVLVLCGFVAGLLLADTLRERTRNESGPATAEAVTGLAGLAGPTCPDASLGGDHPRVQTTHLKIQENAR